MCVWCLSTGTLGYFSSNLPLQATGYLFNGQGLFGFYMSWRRARNYWRGKKLISLRFLNPSDTFLQRLRNGRIAIGLFYILPVLSPLLWGEAILSAKSWWRQYNSEKGHANPSS